jgi:hypothetical protein
VAKKRRKQERGAAGIKCSQIVAAGQHPWHYGNHSDQGKLAWWGTQGNLSGALALSCMTEDFSTPHPRILTSEERKARDAARRADAEQAMREHEAAQRAFYQNRERLKAQRLAREAQANRQIGQIGQDSEIRGAPDQTGAPSAS